jgi:hypothetical protein
MFAVLVLTLPQWRPASHGGVLAASAGLRESAAEAERGRRAAVLDAGWIRPSREDSSSCDFPVVHSSLSLAQFINMLAQKDQPLLIKGGVAHWPALALWTKRHMHDMFDENVTVGMKPASERPAVGPTFIKDPNEGLGDIPDESPYADIASQGGEGGRGDAGGRDLWSRPSEASEEIGWRDYLTQNLMRPGCKDVGKGPCVATNPPYVFTDLSDDSNMTICNPIFASKKALHRFLHRYVLPIPQFPVNLDEQEQTGAGSDTGKAMADSFELYLSAGGYQIL